MTVVLPGRSAAALVAGLLAAGALTAGCGDGSADAGEREAAPSGPAAHGAAHGPDASPGPGSPLGDPAATPADRVPGAIAATFVLLPTRPPGSDAVRGTAWLAQGAKGTTLTVSLGGLQPGARYLGHLHAQPCATKGGGAHFQFDAGGPAAPPNEVHLMLTADGTGKATVTVTNVRQVGAGAQAVVIHPAAAIDNRLACADF
jgi:hypothetical protein